VAGLAALVAGLAGGVERTTVGGGAVARNVAKLAAGIALHGLSLAVTGKVVGATALVASRRARAASEAATTAKGARVAATAHGSATAHRAGVHGVGASASKVAGLATVVAAAAGASATQAESGAVSLHVAESLAVVALLGLGGTGKRAAVGLVTWRNHRSGQSPWVVITWLGCTYQAACSCSRDAQQRSKPRRSGRRCRTCSMLDGRGTTC
jgi:hypothetical protein